MNKNAVVIFDLDGTLLNTLPSIRYYVNLALDHFGIEEISLDECRRFVGKGARNLLRLSLEAKCAYQDDNFEEIFDYYNQEYNSDPYYLTEPYEGINDVLLSLKSAGIPMVVVSNKPTIATKKCVEYFFGGIFSKVVGGGDYPLKPLPDGTLAAIEEFSSAPRDSLFIGDSEVDVLTAKAAGCRSIAVLWGFRTFDELKDFAPDAFCSSTSALLPLILSYLKTDGEGA